MKKLILCFTLFFACVLLSVPASANPTTNFTAIAPTLYENGDNIGPDDSLSYFLYCGTVSGVYTVAFNMTQDFVSNGGEDIDTSLCASSPGTYYFVATAYSFLHKTESMYSSEVNTTYTTQNFSKIPMSPQITSVSP